MRYSTPDNIPIADPGDVLTPLEEHLEDIVTAVQAALAHRADLNVGKTMLAHAFNQSNWGRAGNGSSDVFTYTLNTPTARNIEVYYGCVIDSGGANLGGTWQVLLNGTQLGEGERIVTPGSTKSSWKDALRKYGRTNAGNNTITVRVQADSGSNTIYGNAPSWEIWGL